MAETERVCRALSLRAVERLGLIVTRIQPGTVPQVTMARIAILKGASVVGKGNAGVTGPPSRRRQLHGGREPDRCRA